MPGTPPTLHLLAELIENAVTFSAPGTKALVAGQPLPAGYLLEIEDQGLGMTDEQLAKVNERLVKPPDVDFALAKMLGFFVVTQLAPSTGSGPAPPLLVRRHHRTGAAAPAAGRQPGRPGAGEGAALAERTADPEPGLGGQPVPMVHVPLGGRPARSRGEGRAGRADQLAPTWYLAQRYRARKA